MHRNEYLSGQDLSDVLEISKTAVWKYVKKIRSLGYKIESRQNMGYRLTKDTELLLPWEITDKIGTRFLGRRAYYLDVVDSTQNYAAAIVCDPKENGTVVVAGEQTRGRGRNNRRWISPRGGIWFSIILNHRTEVSKSTLVPLAAAVALARAVEDTLNLKLSLKWPNDLLLDRKKVAGILIDVTLESDVVQNMILGIGINHLVNATSLKRDIDESNRHGVTSLLNKPRTGSAKYLVQRFLYQLECVLENLDVDHRSIIKEWIKRSYTIGKRVRINAAQKIVGKAIGIADDGALLVDSKGRVIKFLTGDIQHLG